MVRVRAIRSRYSPFTGWLLAILCLPDSKRSDPMLKTVPAFDRIGEENAFEVLARADALRGAGPRHHQPRHRPAGLQDARHIVEAAIKALRDGHHGYTPGERHPAAARGGGAPIWQARQASRSTRTTS